MKKSFIVAIMSFVTVGLASSAFAQDSGGRTNASYDREVSFNYSYLRDVGENGSLGFLVDFGKQLTSHLSLVGEVDLNHFSYFEETYVQAAGGVRIGGVTSPRFRPFAQVMVGVQREFGIAGYVVQPGVGMNLAMGGKADLKVQADFPLVRWDADNYQQFRFSVGLGLALGGR